MKLKGNRSALLLVIDQFVTVDNRPRPIRGKLLSVDDFEEGRVLYDLFLTEEIELKSASLSLKTFDTG